MAQVTLRKMTEGDIEQVRLWRNLPEVGQYMYTSKTITPEMQKEWFARVSKDDSCIYWMIEADERAIGVASVTGINRTLESCSWAFYLGDSSVRGGGIGSKVEFQVLDYVFGTLKLRKLYCEVLTTNPKVIQLHEKFGFRRESYSRQHVRKGDETFDVVGLAMLRSEWETLRPLHYQRLFETER